MSRLHAPLGVYSCTGNHEYRYDAEEKIQLLNDAGIIILRDSAVLIDSAFYVVGREDKVILNRKSTKNLFSAQGIDLTKPVIVLNHTPDDLVKRWKPEPILRCTDIHTTARPFRATLLHKLFLKWRMATRRRETHTYMLLPASDL